MSPMTQLCALCGCVFDPRAKACHPSCPLSGACGMVCCPRCGYGTVQEERGFAGMLKKALVRLGRSP